MREAPPQDRITQSAWFERKHRDIEPAVWKRASIGSRANCMACPPGPTRVTLTTTASAFPSEHPHDQQQPSHNAPPAPSGRPRPLPSSATTPRPATRRVVDAATRMLHWLMALSFTGAYITADGNAGGWCTSRWATPGGAAGGSGAVGSVRPRQVRLSVLWRKLQGVARLVAVAGRRALAIGTAGRLAARQNLLMALAVGLILVSIVPLTLSGYAVWDEWGGEWLEEVHEFFGNAMLMVVLVHVGLIAL